MNAIAMSRPTFEPLLLLACENAVRAHPNQTAAELGDMTGAPADDVRDWLQQLAREGRAYIAGFSRCRITGAMANTWMAGRNPDIRPLVVVSNAPPADPVSAADAATTEAR
jgi:hypothetical protein